MRADLRELATLLEGSWASLEAEALREGLVALRTSIGRDMQSDAMGKSTSVVAASATSTTATTLTNTGASFPTAGTGLTGHYVQAGAAYGVILSNSATVLTIDKWYNTASPGGAALATPSGTATYVVLPGNAAAAWIGLTENSTGPADGDTTLTAEITAALGLERALATYAHTAGANTYTLTKTFTSADGTTRTPAKMGVFNAQNGGRMAFTTLIPSPPPLVSGDNMTLTETVSLV